MLKIIFIDLDGTLLNDYKEIPQENIVWIKRAYEEKNVISVITTGRPLDFALTFFKKGNFFADYIIANNGATVLDMRSNTFLLKQVLSDSDVLAARQIFLEEELDYIMAYSEHGTFVEERVPSGSKKNGKNTYNKKTVNNLETDYVNIYPGSTALCILGDYTKDLENTKQKVHKMKGIAKAEICKYYSKASGTEKRANYIDINLKISSKQNAIKVLTKHLGIKKNEVMIIGDGYNDLSMFDAAGTKVAVANAEEILKQKATFVTASNNDSGVAKAIKKFVFLL